MYLVSTTHWWLKRKGIHLLTFFSFQDIFYKIDIFCKKCRKNKTYFMTKVGKDIWWLGEAEKGICLTKFKLLTMYTTFNTTLIVFYSICDGRGNFQEARRFEDGWSIEGISNCHCGSYIGDKAFVLYLIFTTAKTNCRPRGVRVRPTSFL